MDTKWSKWCHIWILNHMKIKSSWYIRFHFIEIISILNPFSGAVRFSRPVVIRSLQVMPTTPGQLWVRGRLNGAEVWRHAWHRGETRCGIGELVLGRCLRLTTALYRGEKINESLETMTLHSTKWNTLASWSSCTWTWHWWFGYIEECFAMFCLSPESLSHQVFTSKVYKAYNHLKENHWMDHWRTADIMVLVRPKRFPIFASFWQIVSKLALEY